MSNTVDPTQLVQQISRVIAEEEFSSDAVSKIREILAPPAPAEGLPSYDYKTATEAERWIYDQAFEDGHQAALDPAQQDLDGIHNLIEVAVAALTRIIEQEKQRGTRGTIEFEGGAVIPLPDTQEDDR